MVASEASWYSSLLDIAPSFDLAVVVSFGYFLPPELLQAFSLGAINLHPSLLPKYKGLDTHARAIAAGDAVGGCSVHVVTEELDGGVVLGQAEVPILAGDDADALAARVLAAEHALYPKTLAEFVTR